MRLNISNEFSNKYLMHRDCFHHASACIIEKNLLSLYN